MKNITALLLVCMLSITSVPTYAAKVSDSTDDVTEKMIYLSPQGTDNNNGTKEHPLKTVMAAKNKITGLIRSGNKSPITVVCEEGEYIIDKTVEFTGGESGTETAPVTIKSADGAKVTFKGSKKLDVTKFERVKNEDILERIPEVARDFVGQLDLKEFGITELPSFGVGGGGNQPIKYMDIYLNDTIQTLSRWPNTGYTPINEIVDQKNGVFRPVGSNITKWEKAENVQVAGHISNTYAYDRTNVLEIDSEERTVQLNTRFTTGGLTNTSNTLFFYNLIEEMDTPGEWYIDGKTMILYYYPPHPLSEEDTLEISVLDKDMISLSSANYITFDGIEFSQTRKDAIGFQNTDHITIKNCYFHNIGRNALYNNVSTIHPVNFLSTMNFTGGATNTLIENNEFYEVGGYAVRVAGGDFKTLTPSGNKILNNHIYHYQTYARYGYGVSVHGVGAEIMYNTIHDSPHGGIDYGGNDNIIKYNELYDLCKESNDCGAFYSGRNLIWRGTEIAYNYIHDVIITEESRKHTGTLQAGIYLDDKLGNIYMHHNVIKNCGRGIFMHGGNDARIEYNVLVDMDYGIGISHCGSRYDNLYADAATMLATYPAFKKYPGMQDEQLYARAEDLFPRGNVVKKNLAVGVGQNAISLSTNVHVGKGLDENDIEDNVINNDYSNFTDPDNQNYTIAENAEILKTIPELGEIDFEKIGLQNKEEIKPDEKGVFIKTSPRNNKQNVGTTNMIFSWEYLPKADRYRLVIAKDEALTQVVYDNEVYYNTVEVNGLKSGNNRYYWDVWAYSNSKDGGDKSIKSTGSDYMLITSKYDNLDKFLLNLAVSDAKETLEKIKVGTSTGDCLQEDCDTFKAAIDKGIEYSNKRIGLQSEINEVTNEVNGAINKINADRIIGYVGIDDMLKSTDDWNFFGTGTLKDGVLEIKGGHGAYKTVIEPYKILKFKMKVDFNGGWGAFGMRQGSPGTMWQGGTGYLLAFKQEEFEYQRFKNGGGGYLQDNIPNDFIIDGQWHDIEVASTTIEGGVWNYLTVDGREILNIVDKSSGYLENAGLFQVYNFAEDMVVSLKPCDNLPENFDKSIMNIDGNNSGISAVDAKAVSLLKDKSDLKADKGNISEKDNVISLQGNGIFRYKEKLSGNEVLTEKMRFKLSEAGSVMLGIRLQSNTADFTNEEGYFAEITKDKITLKRASSDGSLTLAITDNKYIVSNEKVSIEYGAYQTKQGMRIVLFANGNKVFDYTDAYSKLEAGYFAIANDGNANVEIIK